MPWRYLESKAAATPITHFKVMTTNLKTGLYVLCVRLHTPTATVDTETGKAEKVKSSLFTL